MNQGVHYRLVNQNTLSALDNFNEIISIVNINAVTPLLFDIINNAFKLCCPIRTKTLSTKNKNKPYISGDICANIKKRQNYYSLVRQNKMSL